MTFLCISGVFDNCSHSLSEKGWSVGIRTMEPAGTKDARFYFTLRTDRAVKSTTISSHHRYGANAWTHLMATYNGHNMTLYVDGAKVCHIWVLSILKELYKFDNKSKFVFSIVRFTLY